MTPWVAEANADGSARGVEEGPAVTVSVGMAVSVTVGADAVCVWKTEATSVWAPAAIVALTSGVGSPAAGCPPQDARSIPTSRNTRKGRRAKNIFTSCVSLIRAENFKRIRQNPTPATLRESCVTTNIPYFARLAVGVYDGQPGAAHNYTSSSGFWCEDHHRGSQRSQELQQVVFVHGLHGSVSVCFRGPPCCPRPPCTKRGGCQPFLRRPTPRLRAKRQRTRQPARCHAPWKPWQKDCLTPQRKSKAVCSHLIRGNFWIYANCDNQSLAT